MDWNSKYYPDDGSDEWKYHIAANTQEIIEEEILKVFKMAKNSYPKQTICVMVVELP